MGLHIVYLLAPYSNNELKRLSKTPKLYFCDTGLCAYLSMWLTADTLRNGAASGHYYENYVVMELVKNYAYAKSKVNITIFVILTQKRLMFSSRKTMSFIRWKSKRVLLLIVVRSKSTA